LVHGRLRREQVMLRILEYSLVAGKYPKLGAQNCSLSVPELELIIGLPKSSFVVLREKHAGSFIS
jgi:hypothetical protein